MKLTYKILVTAAVLLSTNSSVLTDDGTESVGEERPMDVCPIKLKTAGKCDGEDCPYQITLPPMTIQLPKQFRLLEKTLKEVQNLREVVNKMKKSCQDCKLQADDNQGGDSNEFLPPGPDGSTDNSKVQDNRIKELQNKVSRLSASLKNAKSQIHSLQGQMEQMNLLNTNNVENYVDNKVANLTFAMSLLDNKCSSQCPAKESNRGIQILQGDCADYFASGKRQNGIYRITPDFKNDSFGVYCDMESMGGGWTVFQMRQDGSTDFDRTWNEYKNGFGNLSGDFWLGNDKIHLLTKRKGMQLRIELEDHNGLREYAQYDQFYVANEFLKYRLSIGTYSGTAGDALHFKKPYHHDQRFFSTPDKDNDRSLDRNCAAYYSSGWWFDACFAANLNGKYYKKLYKGIRDGIFWGTWPGVSDAILNGYKKPFQKVRMMLRPKHFVP